MDLERNNQALQAILAQNFCIFNQGTDVASLEVIRNDLEKATIRIEQIIAQFIETNYFKIGMSGMTASRNYGNGWNPVEILFTTLIPKWWSISEDILCA